MYNADGAVESLLDWICLNFGMEITLSVNDLVACCGFMCIDGCHGGYPISTWQYFFQTGVVTSEVLIILPLRSIAYHIVKRLIKLTPLKNKKIGDTEVIKEKNTDYISFIENWFHVNTIMDQLNRLPNKQSDTNIIRIRPLYLDVQASFYRQTIILSAHINPVDPEEMKHSRRCNSTVDSMYIKMIILFGISNLALAEAILEKTEFRCVKAVESNIVS